MLVGVDQQDAVDVAVLPTSTHKDGEEQILKAPCFSKQAPMGPIQSPTKVPLIVSLVIPGLPVGELVDCELRVEVGVAVEVGREVKLVAPDWPSAIEEMLPVVLAGASPVSSVGGRVSS